MMTRVVMLMVLVLLTGSANAWAQSASSAQAQERVVPEEKIFAWRNAGQYPLIPQNLLNKCSGGQGKWGQDSSADIFTIQNVIRGVPGCEEAHQLWTRAVSLLYFDGGPIPTWFMNRVLEFVDRGDFFQQTFHKGYVFFCGMAWGYENRAEARVNGQATLVDHNTPVKAYVLPGIYMESGPHIGRTLSLVLPTICFNLTCITSDVTAEVQGTAPVEESQPAQTLVIPEPEIPAVVPPPPPPVPPLPQVEKGGKKKWWIIGGLAALAAGAYFFPRDKDVNIFVPEVKVPNSSGSPRFNIGFKFGGGG